jgi:hypothetical protein
MSDAEKKHITINVKDLSFKSEQHVSDMIRFMTESLPQIIINRTGNDLEIEMPKNLSKRTIRLRIKKFLHKKDLRNNFRPISFKSIDKEGYIVKERKVVELTYY